MHKYLLSVLILTITIPALCQEKNLAKINLGSLVVKNFAFQYERALGNKTSLALGIRFQSYGKIPFQEKIRNEVNDPDIQVQNIQEGNFAITPEFRYYFGQRALKGFYVAPYARIANYRMEAPVNYNSLLSQKTAYFKGNISSVSGGILFGNQFHLGKRITLDLWLIGGHFGSSNGNLKFTASLTPQEQEDIKQTLSNTDIPLFDIQYDINSNGGTITSKGAWIGFRGLALNLGIRF
jgi:hypothetical protein